MPCFAFIIAPVDLFQKATFLLIFVGELQWKRDIIDSWTSLSGARFRQTRTASRATHSRFLKFRTLGTLIASDWSKNLKETIRFLNITNGWRVVQNEVDGTYHSLLLADVRRYQIVQKKECVGIDRDENMIFEISDETAVYTWFFFCQIKYEFFKI